MRRSIIRRFADLPLALLCVALAGCGSPVKNTVAHKIADALPSLLGPAAHYDVQVSGDTLALTRGRAKSVHIEGQDVQLAPAIQVDTLTVDARDVTFDTRNRQLEHIGPITFLGTMRQTHLDNYLAHTKRLPGLRITLRDNDVLAQVPVGRPPFQTTASLAGTFHVNAPAGDTVDFVASSAHVGIVPLPAPVVNLALSEINPLLDLSHLRDPITVEHVDVTDRRIVLRGTARLNALRP